MTVHPDNADGLQYANFRATDSEFNFMLIDSEDTIGIVCREMSDAERTHLRNRIVAALCYCHGKPTMDLVMQSQRVAGPGQAALIVNRHPAIDVNEAGDLTIAGETIDTILSAADQVVDLLRHRPARQICEIPGGVAAILTRIADRKR